MSINVNKPDNDFARETKQGNGSPWGGLDKNTQPARREIDEGEWVPPPSPSKDKK